eukprot:CAMPEP_0197043876 /NCGR_PEP_ID=MMETSP1384-20130603/20054_1 /TAXON_ID=29189 /ORGANISM="Ammonia sp." /LENGTH=485 /DNA_ID=CAMNT_0042475245 /DNA_START=195 /DNA_END=1652 /DNA_ORIENTATION=-
MYDEHSNHDAKSVKSIKSVKSSIRSDQNRKALEGLEGCTFDLDKIAVLDIPVTKHQQFDHEKAPHGCVIGLPRQSVTNAQDVIDIYQTTLTECISNPEQLLKMHTGFFVYAANHEELRRHHSGIEQHTLFYYIRFGARSDNMQFKLLMSLGMEDYSVSFGVHLYVKKLSIKRATLFRPFMTRGLANINKYAQCRDDERGNDDQNDYREIIESLLPMRDKRAFCNPWDVSVQCAADKQCRYNENERVRDIFNDGNTNDLCFAVEANPNNYPKMFQRPVVSVDRDRDYDVDDRKENYHEPAMEHHKESKPKQQQHNENDHEYQLKENKNYNQQNKYNYDENERVDVNGNQSQPLYQQNKVNSNESVHNEVNLHTSHVNHDESKPVLNGNAGWKHNANVEMNSNANDHDKKDEHTEQMDDALRSAFVAGVDRERVQVEEGNGEEEKQFVASMEFMRKLWTKNQALMRENGSLRKENEMLKQRLRSHEK